MAGLLGAALGTFVPSGAEGQEKSARHAGRRLDFRISPDFKDAPLENIEAVLRSAAETMWPHCPQVNWQCPGFLITKSKDFPVTAFDRAVDGRIIIGLATGSTYWAQYAFQFAHEFVHALAGHSNDATARKPWLQQKLANQWLEEALCEAGSLFALRAMEKSWAKDPPYPQWRDFAPRLGEYAQERITAAAALLDSRSFIDWFHAEEKSLRETPVQREKNLVVAAELLPLFEKTPQGWETTAFYHEGARDPQAPLVVRFEQWHTALPENHRPFLRTLAAKFGAVVS